MILTGENRRYSGGGGGLSQKHFVHQKSHINGPIYRYFIWKTLDFKHLRLTHSLQVAMYLQSSAYK
jgi:hypothetical protein